MVLIPKISKNPKTRKATSSKQLEIWDKIEAQRLKEQEIKRKLILQIEKKNQSASDKLKEQVAKIDSRISEIQGTLPKDFNSKFVHKKVKEEYFRRLAEIKSLRLGKLMIVEYATLIENTTLLASDLSKGLSVFLKMRKLSSSSIKYIDNINQINEDLKSNRIEHYQKAENLIKLSNNLIQLRKSLSGSYEGRNRLTEFDLIISKVLENKVPF